MPHKEFFMKTNALNRNFSFLTNSPSVLGLSLETLDQENPDVSRLKIDNKEVDYLIKFLFEKGFSQLEKAIGAFIQFYQIKNKFGQVLSVKTYRLPRIIKYRIVLILDLLGKLDALFTKVGTRKLIKLLNTCLPKTIDHLSHIIQHRTQELFNRIPVAIDTHKDVNLAKEEFIKNFSVVNTKKKVSIKNIIEREVNSSLFTSKKIKIVMSNKSEEEILRMVFRLMLLRISFKYVTIEDIHKCADLILKDMCNYLLEFKF